MRRNEIAGAAALVGLMTLAAAPAVRAQSNAQPGMVLSGIIDVGPRVDRGAVLGSTSSIQSGGTTGSRLNFSGVEDLGDGYKAGFVLEAGVAVDSGGGNSNPPGVTGSPLTFGRTSIVSVGGEQLGYVALGRQYTPIWAVTASPGFDPFAGSWLGGANINFGNTVRASNSIAYTWGYGPRGLLLPAPREGFTAAALYSFSELPSPLANAGRQLGFSLTYGTGPWMMGYGYHQIRGNNQSISTAKADSESPKLDQHTASLAYEFGFMRLFSQFHQSRNDATGATAFNRRAFALGAQVPFLGNQAIRFEYGRTTDRTAANASYSNYQISYSYNFSKRTFVYAGFGALNNNANSSAAFNSSAGTFANGSSPRSFISGVRHDF